MKMTVTLLFMVGSMLLTNGFAQSTATPERKYYYLNLAEENIQSLPFSQDSISNFVLPEIMAKRNELAPNFPVYQSSASEENKKNAFFTWLTSFPEEFEAYYPYIATYIRTNQAH